MAREPIRKAMNSVVYSTEESEEIFGVQQFFIVPEAGSVTRNVAEQALYRTKDGAFFLSLWNMPEWNKNSVRFELENQIQPINQAQAFTWLMENAPTDVFATKVALFDHPPGDMARAALTIRIPARVREHIENVAAATGQSVNKVCTGMLESAIAFPVTRIYAPRFHEYTFSDGEQSLDEFGRSRDFKDPRKNKLAQIAEDLVISSSGRYDNLFLKAVSKFNKLLVIDGDEQGALVVARWLAKFHRWTRDDHNEYVQNSTHRGEDRGV